MTETLVAPNGREFEAREDGRVAGEVRVPVDDFVALDREALRSRLGEELTGSDRVADVDWRIEEAEGPDAVRVLVVGDASDVLRPAVSAPTP